MILEVTKDELACIKGGIVLLLSKTDPSKPGHSDVIKACTSLMPKISELTDKVEVK